MAARIIELERSVAGLEIKMRNGKEKERKLKQIKIEFLTLILKHGIDSREDGVVWIMRSLKKYNIKLRDDYLPEFIDSGTKDFIMNKFVQYNEMMNLQEKNTFYLKFYKLMVGEFSAMDQVVKDVKEKLKKDNDNPYWEMISETDSIRIATAHPYSTMGRRENSGIQLKDEISNAPYTEGGGRLESAFAPSIMGGYYDPHKASDDHLILEAYQDGSDLRIQSSNSQQHEELGTVSPQDQLASRNVSRTALAIPEDHSSAVHFETNISNQYSSARRVDTAQNQMVSRSQVTSSRRPLPPISGRSLASAAYSALITRKKEEFSRLGVVYIGDANYRFSKNRRLLLSDNGACEAVLLGNELVSQAVRAYRKKEHKQMVERGYSAANLSSKSNLASTTGQEHDTVVEMMEDVHPEDEIHHKELKRSMSSHSSQDADSEEEQRRKRAQEEDNGPVLVGEEEDPFTTHVLFFDEDVLINNFRSKMELVKEHIRIEQSSFYITQEFQY
jgi:hypothetical protein